MSFDPPPPPGATWRTRRAGDQTLEVLEAGRAGPPVLLIHASGMGGRQWFHATRRWSKAHRTRALNLPGYGDSGPWPDDDSAVERDLDAVLAVARALDAPAHLVGHSYGGYLALRAAAVEPARVRSLSVFEPIAFSLLGEGPAAAELRRFEDEGGLDPAHGGDPEWMRRFIEYWNQPGLWDALFPAQREALVATGRKVFWEVRGALRDQRGPRAFAGLRVPTLVLWGAQTTAAGRAAAEAVARAVPGARLQRLPGVGHMAPISRPAPFLQAVEAHWRGLA